MRSQEAGTPSYVGDKSTSTEPSFVVSQETLTRSQVETGIAMTHTGILIWDVSLPTSDLSSWTTLPTHYSLCKTFIYLSVELERLEIDLERELPSVVSLPKSLQ